MFAYTDDRKAPGDSWIHHTVWQDSDTPTEEDITMFQFMQRLGRDSHSRWRGNGAMTRVRRRNHPLNCEALEGRQLLSVTQYYIVNAASGKVLDDPGGSTSNGTAIIQNQLNGGASQKWTIQKDYTNTNGQTVDLIVNVSSGKVLDDTAFGTNPGTSVIQYQEQSGNRENQDWTLHKLSDGNYQIHNEYSGLYLDDPHSETGNDVDIDQWTLNGSGTANQEWTLIAASTNGPVTYSVENASSKLVLDDPNSSASNGTGIVQWQSNGGTNQKWTFVPLADGNDLIVNQASGLVLGDPGFSQNRGTGIIQWQLNGGLNEQWQVNQQANGTYEIVNAYSGLVLEDPGSSTTEGIQVDQWNWNGTANQEWYLNQT
jgi:alpha-galactosidase